MGLCVCVCVCVIIKNRDPDSYLYHAAHDAEQLTHGSKENKPT